MRTAIFPAKFDQLDLIREFVAHAARDVGMDEAEVYSVEVAVDEACTNVIEHAYRGIQGGDIECTCETGADALTVVIRDHGKSFDPTRVPAPDLGSDLKNRRSGGLGIYLMRRYMDEVRFETLGESGNLVTMVKHRRRKA